MLGLGLVLAGLGLGLGLDTVGLVNITGTGRRHVIRHVGRCSRVQVDGSIEERQHKQLSYC